MADEYMAGGMNYFDTAYMYHDGRSELMLNEAVTKRYPRESFLAADKLPMWEVGEPGDLEKIFNEQLRRTGLEYFDFYLLHAVNKDVAEKAERFGAFDFMRKLKAEKKVRYIGFSYHDSPEFLDSFLAKHNEYMEFIQLQINYLDWEYETRAKELYETARRYSKPIIVMEPIKGGTLADPPGDAAKLLKKANPNASSASWALRYVASLDGIMTILSGMSSLEQMRDNISVIRDFKPIDGKEAELIAKAAEIFKKAEEIPCTGCEYCIDCPMMINIPKNFSIYNNYKRKLDIKTGKADFNAANPGCEAQSCIACGRCEGLCPQSIKIIDCLKKVVHKFS
jgi:predicted aldo/keto reductase-like oxidoreductase